MFGRQLAFAFGPAGAGPWTWRRGRQHGGPDPRCFAWGIRRGFFGPGGPFGEGGFPGFPGWGRHFFGRGDLKYVLLELLLERPMHGYEMMKALQEQTGGRYTPSAGSIYPTLQMLEDRGFVGVSEVGGKKVYHITDAGRAFLAEGRREDRGDAGRRGPWHAPDDAWAEMAALGQELRTLGPLFGSAVHSARRDPEKHKRLRALIDHVRAELAAIAGEGGGLV